MKKSSLKKLSLSLKNGGVKQQKISTFFVSSKSPTLKKEEETEFVFGKEISDGKAHGRSSGENLCPQCLHKSSPSSNICSQCNTNEDSSSKVKHRLLECDSSNEFSSKSSDCKSKVVVDSPEVICPTPPIKNKQQKHNIKPVKRKCSFDVKIQSNKKPSLNQSNFDNDLTCHQQNNPDENILKENVISVQKSDVVGENPSKLFSKLYTNEDSSRKPPKCINDVKKDKKKTEKINESNITHNSIHSKIENTSNEFIVVNSKNTTNYNLGTDCNTSEPSRSLKNKTATNVKDVFISKKTTATNLKDVINNENEIATNAKEISNNVNKIENSFDGARSVEQLLGEKSLHPLFDSQALFSTIPFNNVNFEEYKHAQVTDNNSLIEDDIENLFDDSTFFESTFKEPLRLDSNTRCRVVSVEHLKACGELVLALTSGDTKDTATCVLRGSWAKMSISPGDTVNVSARSLQDQEGCWVIDNEGGMVVIHPDTLLSGTTVVGSLFCMRRSVLGDMYRGIDSDSSIMVIGSFLHHLLQEVLKRKVKTLKDIERVLEEFTKTPYFISNLYSSSMSLEKTVETLREFVPKIQGFIQKYMSPKSKVSTSWNEGDSWNGSIQDVADIEENIWSPSLGLKGKIDVTVKTSSRNYKEKVMPLELKTGRASFSAEHRGQVILYTMMMSELGKTVDTGLLLYLREGVMKEVPVGSVERRDLMLLRNELVCHLKASHKVVVASNNQITAPTLPPPIHHHSACSKCPYLTLCTAALRVSECSELSEKNPLRQLSESSTSHLSMEHIMFVFHWTGLLRLEHTDSLLNSPTLHHIWTVPPADRAKKGTCLPRVKLVEQVVEVVAGSYQHVFHNDSNTTASFSQGEYMIVSSASRPAVAAGPITHLSQSRLTLMLERDLSTHQVTDNVWCLDKYESQSGLVFNMTNLGCLLDCTEQAERLRRAVIDLTLPDFSPKLSSRVLKASVDLLSDLNDQQRKAIFRALAADHYILIKGMPGTGKTATIVALVQLAVRLGRSVLITSHTHSAVDNVLLRLLGKVDFLRLGAAHKLHPQLAQYGETNQAFASPEELYTFYCSKNVVGVTCLGSAHPLLARRKFDLCIVDEATQVLLPTVLRPLYSAHKFILIGDPNQLPPLVRSSKAKDFGLGESLFARLDRLAVTTELCLQYRMNQTITDLANCLTYSGKLKCGNTQVAAATISLPPSALVGESDWVKATLGQSLSEAVVVVDTGVCEAIGFVNKREADIVLKLLATVTKGLSGDKVGVIAPYRAQVDYLAQRVKSSNSTVEVNTVDQYQGRDKDIILFSCTRSTKPGESDILGDKNRLTVAVTRARHKLIIVGNFKLLRGYPTFNQLFDFLPQTCIVPVSDKF